MPKTKELRLLTEVELKIAGITMCNTRLNKTPVLSKKKMKEDFQVNAHTLNKIESGEYKSIIPFIEYCNAVGYELILKEKAE